MGLKGPHVSSRDPIWACRRSSCATGSKPDMSKGLRRTGTATVVLSPGSNIVGPTPPGRHANAWRSPTQKGTWRRHAFAGCRRVLSARLCDRTPTLAWKIDVASIRLDHVTKRFDGRHPAVDDVSLDIPAGEIVILVGPRGGG